MEAWANRFTAPEGGTRLACVANAQNTLVAEHTAFVATRLIHENAYMIRGSLYEGQQRSVYVTRPTRVDFVAFELSILTDLSVLKAVKYDDVYDWCAEIDKKEVLVCTSAVLRRILEEEVLTMNNINVMIMDSCHLIYSDEHMQYIMTVYKEHSEDKRPRILALTYPLFTTLKKDCQTSTDNTHIDTDGVLNNDNIEANNTILNNDNGDEKDKTNKDVIGEKEKDSTKDELDAKSESKDTNIEVDNLEDNVDVCKALVKYEAKEEQVSKKEPKIQNINNEKSENFEELGVVENLDDFDMYEKLEWKIEQLEKELCCQMDLAEDVEGGKRLLAAVSKPKELIIEYVGKKEVKALPQEYVELETFMRDTVNAAMDWLYEHRYDPMEIYGDELYEEFINIPNPTIDPKCIFKQFLYILDQLGPYAADKAALSLLAKLEKLKIKVPYERHFLLLCLCTSVFVKIRCYADLVFANYESDWDKISLFCTPKLLRLAEILEKFDPPEHLKLNHKNGVENSAKDVANVGNSNNTVDNVANMVSNEEKCVKNVETCVDNVDTIVEDPANMERSTDEVKQSNKKGENTFESSADKMLHAIEKCDFLTLGNKIEDKMNTYAANLREIDDFDLQDSVSAAETENRVSKENIEDKITTNAVASKEMEEVDIHNAVNSTETDNRDCIQNKLEDKANINAVDLIEIDNTNIQNTVSVTVTDNIVSEDNKVEVNCIIQNGVTVTGTDDMVRKEIATKQVYGRQSSGMGLEGCVRGRGARMRGRGRPPRSSAARAQLLQLNPDALCGIIFVKDALMAKILFMLIADMSRCNSKLSYLCAQFCAVENPADPGTEPKECQRQGKKQEEVLKKFRMHECNLLLATSALEEGIDLPRCNLVLRWDVPASYRSYGMCRSRARAARSGCALLAEAGGCSDLTLHHLATYNHLDRIITRKCGCGVQNEPPPFEEDHADIFTRLIKAYSPNSIDKKDDKRKTKPHQTENCNNIHETETKVNNEVRNTVKSTVTNHINNVIAFKTVNNIKNKDDIVKNEVNITNDINIGISEENSDKINSGVNKTINNELLKNVMYTDDVIDNDKSNELKNNVNNENVLCNKCNAQRDDIEVECPCILAVEISAEKIDNNDFASVDMNSAIALINRYCGKLPSDTFTRLAPQWWTEEVQLPVRGSTETKPAFICTLRLPLNCPVKYNIVGHPMPSRVLARRMVALQACRILHKSGELDNHLMPIGKENFKAAELETLNYDNSEEACDAARPGTTKRRQYYFKRTAWAFTDCQPVEDTNDSEIDPLTASEQPKIENGGEANNTKGAKRNMLYAIVSKLWCALPERYNTRGRRLHAPQHASEALGLLMARDEPVDLQIPAFPVYTRSGEVRVSVEYVPDADVRVSPRRGRLVRRFMRFVFAEVLRVRRRGMKLQSEGTTHNNYYIVPTIKTKREDGSMKIDIDWAFLELIYQHTEQKKHSEIEKPILWHQDEEEQEQCAEMKSEVEHGREGGKDDKVKTMDNPLLKPGETFVFDPEKYKEAVVTPWYRNQDQPQFFLVAEICWHLSPESAFPSEVHDSFRGYYGAKYGASLTQPRQPLLDVDHTSARLNLLTPRYVNRKGVALPVSSERTRRAKRDRLDQKQILVPELCRVHPFAAPLWFATVALPCVLYRINALLIADEIRRSVAIEVGLGIPKIDETTCPGFQWPALDFGWSLAEVLSADAEKNEKKGETDKGGGDADKRDEKENDIKEKEKSHTEEEEKDSQQNDQEETKNKTLNDILQEKEANEEGFEIGTWSNDMAYSVPEAMEYDEYMEPLPPNLTFCTSASGGTNWCDPIEKPKNQFQPSRTFSMADSDCSYMSSDFDTDDSDLDSEVSDEDTDMSGFCSSKNSNAAMGVRIEYRTAHEAEAVEVGGREGSPRSPRAPRAPPPPDHRADRLQHAALLAAGDAPAEYVNNFRSSVAKMKKEILENGFISRSSPVSNILPEVRCGEKTRSDRAIVPSIANKASKIDSRIDEKTNDLLNELFPYGLDEDVLENGQVTLEGIEKNKRKLLADLKKRITKEEIKKLNCFSMIDVDIDSPEYVNEKVLNVGFDSKESYADRISKWGEECNYKPYYMDGKAQNGKEFDFDYQPDLEHHPGPSPSVILQALTMSNANDGINLERLETIGDSFLKFAITAYLYCAHPTVHEGKLSHMRSKQVSNLNLYRLGRNKRLGARMIASKFEPHDNWLPPCHKPPATLHPRLNESQEQPQLEMPTDTAGCFIPYNLITQHSIPDKSIADCVEALIGAYLMECGPRGALLFMSWLGIRVLPRHELPLPGGHPYVLRAEGGCQPLQQQQKPTCAPARAPRSAPDSDSESSCSAEEDPDTGAGCEPGPEPDWGWPGRPVGSLRPYRAPDGHWMQPIFGELRAPPSPLLRYIEDPEGELERMLSGYEGLERTLRYRFRDRALLLQALTHASHHTNRLTDCYQRLEFLGDAILDYLITRHLFEDRRRHSPGALTDLRSALVNNTIFATLAARHGFHKYFRHMSPGLNEVLTKYVTIQEENGHSISEEHYLIQEDEMEQAEDVEVPKALGDLFESVAGAIFLDSGMSLGAVWQSYVNLMGAELEAFSAAAPKSPVRELLEAEPDTAKFGKPERLADGRRVRVCVEVFGRGAFKGIGRNYRIAKGTAARCALRHLKKHKTH